MISWTAPERCKTDTTDFSVFQADVLVDGQRIGGVGAEDNSSTQRAYARTREPAGGTFIFEPGRDVGRIMEVRLYDNCTEGHYRVDSFEMNVIASR